MRWSNLFVPTLREAPGDAEARSHALLIRAGFIRQLHAGHYSLLPLGWRVHNKVANIVREEMDSLGGQEFLLPTMHPASIWKQSGRWDTMGEIMFRLNDRRNNEMALGITHEEIFSTVATELSSYKELPQIWYQIQLKFRDEARAKSGLLRVREFSMKDSYSFDVDSAGLDKAFETHREAYTRIFDRLKLTAMPVEASSGAMGGNASVEFMVPCDAGEDDVASCDDCGYSANVEKATSALPPLTDEPGPGAPERFATPGVRTIEELVTFEGGAASDRQIKTLVMVIDDEPTLVTLRGDHQLNDQKLIDATGAINVRQAKADEIVSLLGAHPGSLGPVGVTGTNVIVDEALRGRTNMTTGANEDDWHLRGVSVERDIDATDWADLRQVVAGESCPRCEGTLRLVRCVEAGHIFKLGTTYAEKFNLKVATSDGGQTPIFMGSYGIGIGRNMATVAETHNDENGLAWPVSVAPFEVVITTVKNDETSMSAAESIYEELKTQRVDVLLDDRDARAGVKFADAELVGIPYRITIGPRALKEDEVEFTRRSNGETSRVGVDEIVQFVTDAVSAAR